MNLLHFNMITISLCCFLLVGGFSLRERRVAPAVMMLTGVAGLCAVVVYNLLGLSG